MVLIVVAAKNSFPKAVNQIDEASFVAVICPYRFVCVYVKEKQISKENRRKLKGFLQLYSSRVSRFNRGDQKKKKLQEKREVLL